MLHDELAVPMQPQQLTHLQTGWSVQLLAWLLRHQTEVAATSGGAGGGCQACSAQQRRHQRQLTDLLQLLCLPAWRA
jgi:hypothetical protein